MATNIRPEEPTSPEVGYDIITTTTTHRDEPGTTIVVEGGYTTDIKYTGDAPVKHPTIISSDDFKKLESKSRITYLFTTVTVIRYIIVRYNQRTGKEEVAFECDDYVEFTGKFDQMKKSGTQGLRVKLVDGNEPEKAVEIDPQEFSTMMDKPEFKSLVEIQKRPELRYNIATTTKTVRQEEPTITEFVSEGKPEVTFNVLTSTKIIHTDDTEFVRKAHIDVEDEIVELPDHEVHHTEDDESTMLDKIDADVKFGYPCRNTCLC
jgi:multimeric flavodoxin WrbA